MEITPLKIYLVEISSHVALLFLLLFIFFLVWSINESLDFERYEFNFNKIRKRNLLLSVLFLTLFCITPSTKQCYKIFGIPMVASMVVNNELLTEDLPELGSKAVKYLGRKLDEKMEEHSANNH